jgi:hypothetical protein
MSGFFRLAIARSRPPEFLPSLFRPAPTRLNDERRKGRTSIFVRPSGFNNHWAIESPKLAIEFIRSVLLGRNSGSNIWVQFKRRSFQAMTISSTPSVNVRERTKKQRGKSNCLAVPAGFQFA